MSFKPAIVTSLLSSFFFAATLTFSKVCLLSLPLNQIVFFKSLLSLAPTLFFIFRDKKEQSVVCYLKTNRIGIHLIRAVGGILTVYLFLFALRTVSVAQTTLFTNTTPLFVPLIAYIWNRSKIGPKIWGGIATAFTGMFFFLHPSPGSNDTGTLFALSSGLVGAITLVTVRISHGTEPTFRTVFYYNCFSCVLAGTLCLFDTIPFNLSFPALTALSAIAILGFFSQLFYTLSLKHAPAKLVACFSYIALIFSFIFDCFLGKTEILFLEIFGTVLILSGITFVTFSLHQSKEKNSSLLKDLKKRNLLESGK